MNELSDEIRIQRCVASPTLFNLYKENMFRHIINMKGVIVGGTNYNNIIYADDTALLAGYEKELSELTNKINEIGKQFGMKINFKKTNAMVVSKKPNSAKINIAIDGQQIEQVTLYIYLGSLITEDGSREIRKGDQEKKNDSTEHIHQHENTTIVSKHKPENQIKSNKMLYLANTILWSREMDNYNIFVVQT